MKNLEITFDAIKGRIEFLAPLCAENSFPQIENVLADLLLTRSEYYRALAWARKNAHDQYLEVYAMLGKKPRTYSASEETQESADETEETTEEPPGRLQIFTEVMAWLEQASQADRASIIATAAVFYEVPPR